MSRLTSAATEILFHDERAVFLLRLGGEAFAEVADNLVLHFFAARAPALRAGELLDAAAQSAKAQDARRLLQLHPQFTAQPRKEEKFKAVGGFARDEAEISFENLFRERRRFVGVKGEAKIAQNFFERDGEFADGDG